MSHESPSDREATRFRRQMQFAPIGMAGQDRLRQSRVAIVGMGALGSMIAERLTRSGIGMLRLIDRDWVELDNLPRQSLYEESDAVARLPKAIAAEQHLRKIDDTLRFDARVEDVTHQNIATLLDDIDLVMDGTDNFESRYLMNDYCLSADLPWVHGGCVGGAGQVLTVVPGITACWRCLVPYQPEATLMGTCDSVGVLGAVVAVIAGWQCVEAVKLLTQGRDSASGKLMAIDAWNGEFRSIDLAPLRESGDCEACLGNYPFLEGRIGSKTAVLCGRNAVQLYPSSQRVIDLDDFSTRIAPDQRIVQNPFLVRFYLDDVQCTLFRDGRAIFEGTQDPSVARTLYDRWIGR